MTISNRVAIAAIVENIFSLCNFAMIVIFAPGAWKFAGIICILNLNTVRTNNNGGLQ